ncbi:MAG: hypothetical protein Q9208_007353 [Pyrenodesmia sp. 3 TL-2023]
MASNGVIITPANRGPWINVFTWILLIVACLVTAAKVFSKWVLLRVFQYDDAHMVASTLIAIGHGVAVSVQVVSGLGRTSSSWNTENVLRFQKAAYASQFLYVVSLCLAKLAVQQFLLTLARAPVRYTVVKSLMIFSCVWAIVAMFTIVFQCPTPQTWRVFSNRCFDQAAFWDVFGIVDALVDLASSLIPTYLLWGLQMPWSRKIPVMVSLASRALLVPLIVIRLVFINSAFNSSNHQRDDFRTVMATSIHVNLSILLSCMPFVKPVMDSLHTGILASDIHTMRPIQCSNHAVRWLREGRSTRSEKLGSAFELSRSRIPRSYTTTAEGNEEEHGERGLSVSPQERMVIKQTTTIAVQVGTK